MSAVDSKHDHLANVEKTLNTAAENNFSKKDRPQN